MAILAQKIIELESISWQHPYAERCFKRAQSLLIGTPDKNHIHMTKIESINAAANAISSAQVFTFSRDILESCKIMAASKKNFDHARSIAKLPANPCFFEISLQNGSIVGALLTECDGVIDICAFQYDLSELAFLFHASMDPRQEQAEIHFGLNWTKKSQDLANLLSVRIFLILAMMNVPRCVIAREFIIPERIQQKRIRRRLPRLLSYNHVSLNLPKTSLSRRRTVIMESGSPRRFHHVCGYLRISRHGDPEAYFIWVKDAWRGEASAGVVHKTREVTLQHEPS